MMDIQDPVRRKLLEMAFSGIVGGMVWDAIKLIPFVVATGAQTTIVRDIINPTNTRNTQLFERYLNIENVIQVYPGEGNILAAAKIGEKQISRYINAACNGFAGFFPKRDDYIRILYNKASQLTDEQDILHLGGPVANMLGGNSAGYNYEMRDGKAFPTLVGNTRFRWGFDVGQDNYGDRGITLRSEDGVAKPRPKYALIDNKSSTRLIFPKLDDIGRSLEDWLLVTRTPNVYSKSSKNILSIGGMHGHSLEAFSNSLYSSFIHLEENVIFSSSPYFQILLPCRLIHSIDDTGAQRTRAVIMWDKFEYETI